MAKKKQKPQASKKKQTPQAEAPVLAGPDDGDKKGDDGLTFKQHRFVVEFLVDTNATQAAIRAGYSKRSAREIGYSLLQKPAVKAAVRRLFKELQDKTIMSVDEILKEYSRIGRSDILDYLSFDGKDVVLNASSELIEAEARAIAKVAEKVNKDGSKSVSFELHSKTHGLDSLAKYYKLFGDQQVNVNLSWVDLMTDVHDRKAKAKAAEAKAKAEAEAEAEDDGCSTQAKT